jgi:hypothetical protein
LLAMCGQLANAGRNNPRPVTVAIGGLAAPLAGLKPANSPAQKSRTATTMKE